MQITLGHLSFVEIYLDDITVHSKTLKEHFVHLKAVFKALEEVGLKINPEKCTFCAKKLKLLGHVITGKEVGMDPAKISALKNRIPPTKIKEVQEFLGICGYYSRFIKNFSENFCTSLCSS